MFGNVGSVRSTNQRGRRLIARAATAAVLAAATFGVGLSLASNASAATTSCNTTYSGGTFVGSLTVPNGSVCTLTNETVQGSVVVQQGGTLDAAYATITGSITATKAYLIDLWFSSAASLVVTGLDANAWSASTSCGSTFNSVTIQKIAVGNNDNEFDFGDDAEGDPYVCPGNTVYGSLTLTANSAETEVDSNWVGGSVIVSGNTGPVDLSGNTIQHNLVCVSPTVEGQPNNPKDDEVPNWVGGTQSCVINTAG
jgi:hypothetical protein